MSRHNGVRSKLLVGFATASTALLVGSAGWACTIFKGQMTVTGNADPPASVTVVGSNRGMSYCGSPTRPASGRALAADSGYTYVDSDPSSPDANAQVSVAPYVDPRDATGDYGSDGRSCTGQLPDGLYNVNFVNQPAFTNVDGMRAWILDCMYSEDESVFYPGVKHVGTMDVINGAGSGEYNLDPLLVANGPADESAMCVSNAFEDESTNTFPGLYGIQAPVTVL